MTDSDRPTDPMPIGYERDTIADTIADAAADAADIDDTGDRAAILPSDAMLEEVTT